MHRLASCLVLLAAAAPVGATPFTPFTTVVFEDGRTDHVIEGLIDDVSFAIRNAPCQAPGCTGLGPRTQVEFRSGGHATGFVDVRGTSGASVTGASLEGFTLFDDATLVATAGQVASVVGSGRSRAEVRTGTGTFGATLRDEASAIFDAGASFVFLSGRSAISIEGRGWLGGLEARDDSFARLASSAATPVGQNLAVYDRARLEIDAVGRNPADLLLQLRQSGLMVVRGGDFATDPLVAMDPTATIRVVGSGFEFLSPTRLAGTLADGNAFEFHFVGPTIGTVELVAVPEPTSAGLVASGLAALGWRRQRRRPRRAPARRHEPSPEDAATTPCDQPLSPGRGNREVSA